MSTKGKINPKKVKKEKIKKIEKNTDNMTDNMIDIDSNGIRAPLDSYAEQLLPSNHAFIFNQEDDELKRILELSRIEFEEQQHNYSTNYLNEDNIKIECIEKERINEECIEQESFDQERIELARIDQERIELARIEQERIELARIEQERIEQERIKLARIEQERIEQERIKLACIEQERIEQERIKLACIEQERIEQSRIEQIKSERRNSLLNFSNRINKLIHVKEDKKIKELIDNILEKYFNLEIDSFKLNKKDYIDLYKIIDTYYQIPSSKNIKTAISKEENELVRNIFLK